MTMTNITNADIHRAANMDNSDVAVRSLMEIASITTGDIAVQVFSGFLWETVAYEIRAGKLREWLHTETLHNDPQIGVYFR